MSIRASFRRNNTSEETISEKYNWFLNTIQKYIDDYSGDSNKVKALEYIKNYFNFIVFSELLDTKNEQGEKPSCVSLANCILNCINSNDVYLLNSFNILINKILEDFRLTNIKDKEKEDNLFEELNNSLKDNNIEILDNGEISVTYNLIDDVPINELSEEGKRFRGILPKDYNNEVEQTIYSENSETNSKTEAIYSRDNDGFLIILCPFCGSKNIFYDINNGSCFDCESGFIINNSLNETLENK